MREERKKYYTRPNASEVDSGIGDTQDRPRPTANKLPNPGDQTKCETTWVMGLARPDIVPD